VLRSVLVVVFIGGIAAGATYLAQRPTVARGDVIAADLLATNGLTLRALECDPEIVIGIDGAHFFCDAAFRKGVARRLEFKMDRTGAIKQIGQTKAEHTPKVAPEPTEPEHVIDKSDPWR
jgi:hypothetical protein